MSMMVGCCLRSPNEGLRPQQGSGQQGKSEHLHQVQELRLEDVPIYGRTHRGPIVTDRSHRLQKDREEEKMHKAAPSLPGPTRKSRLPGSTSRDHSKSPSNAQAPSLQGAHKILSKMSKSHLPDKA